MTYGNKVAFGLRNTLFKEQVLQKIYINWADALNNTLNTLVIIMMLMMLDKVKNI